MPVRIRDGGKRNHEKPLLICTVILLLAVFCCSGWQLISVGQEYKTGEKTCEAIAQYVFIPETGEHNSAGSLFLEAGIPRDFSKGNNPVYGHSMKNGSIFAGLAGYKDQTFYEEHPVALLLTPEGNYQVKIFSAWVLDADGDAWDLFFTEETLGQWLDTVIRRSYIATGVVPTTEDRVLTLSTCSYETDDSRFLVHGILIPENRPAASTRQACF